MTIFDTGYGVLSFEPVGPWGRLWPLIRQEFLQLFRTRKGLLVFIACVAFVVVKGVVLWARLGADSEAMDRGMEAVSRIAPSLSPFRREFYIDHATQFGWLPFLILTGLVSVRSIAADKAANALEIYWTRGISPWGYFLAKWMGSFLLLGAAFFAGPLLLWVYGLISAPNAIYMETTAQFMPQVLGALLLGCLVLSFMAVGFSGISSTPNTATFAWLLLIGLTKVVGEMLNQLVRSRAMHDPEYVADQGWYDALCPFASMVRIQEDIAGVAQGSSDYDEVWIAWLVLGVVVGLLLFRLRQQLRTTEAVA